MLIWMRDSAGAGIMKFFLMGLLVLAVAGLVLMDVGGFFTGNIGSNTIVKGGGVNIGVQEFDRTLRRALTAQGIPAQEAMQLGLVDTILNSEIQSRLFTDEARDLGLEVSDESVTRQIAKLAEPLANDGRTKKEALQQILRTQGISEAEFVGSIRQEMANTLLRAALQPPPTLASPLMAQDLYRFDNEKRDAKIIVFKNADAKDIVQPTDEQIEKYYESNKMDFLIPESRTITMATLKGDMLKKNVKITDEQLRADYDKNIATFTKPPRRKVEQAVYNTEDEAKAALVAVSEGKPMKDSLTQEYEEAGLLPEIGAPVFAAPKDGVVGPIKTQLGWHVIKVMDILPEDVISFASVKDRLRTEMENIAMTEELFNTGNTIEDRVAGGETLENLVKEYGMTTEIIGPFRRNGYDKDGKDMFKSFAEDRAKLVQSAYDYDVNEIAPVVETADGQFHLIRIDQVIPDTFRDFETVKADLKTHWIAEQQKLSNQAKAKAAFAELSNGAKIEDVAAKNGVTIKAMAGINRKETPPAPLTPVSTAQIFTTAKGKAFSGEIADGFVVGQVDNITLPPADAKPNAEELTALKDLTGRSLPQDILGEYIANLTDGKKIKINRQRLEQIYAAPTGDPQ